MIRFETVPATPSTPEPTRCMRTLVERLASDMRELAFSGAAVNEETLSQRGWSRDIVSRLGEDALRIARRASVRQIAGA